MTNSDDASSRKCFSGVLSRLLCSGSLPTHPSDQFIESSIDKVGDLKHGKCLQSAGSNIKQVETKAALTTPGLVARLMGLESFPTTPRERILSDFFRSKSVNSIDFLSHFDPVKPGQHHHRRVRTSVSFRDQGINDDFTSMIQRLEREGYGKEEDMLMIRERPNVRNQHQHGKEVRRNNREYFQASNRPGKNREYFQVSSRPRKTLEMEEERKSGPGKMPGNSLSRKNNFQGRTRVNLKERRAIINCEEELVISKCVKKKKEKVLANKLQRKKKIHPQGNVPEVGRGVCSRGAHSDNVINIRRKMKIKESCYYRRMVEEMCTLREEDVKENWINGMVLRYEDFEEICQQFGQEILEVLLKQIVDELVLLFGTRNK